MKGNTFGNPKAPLLIEVFSDFECPACKYMHDKEVPQIMKDFVDKHKAYMIYRYDRCRCISARARLLNSYSPRHNSKSTSKLRMHFSRIGGLVEGWPRRRDVRHRAGSGRAQKSSRIAKRPRRSDRNRARRRRGHIAAVTGNTTLLITLSPSRYPLSGPGVINRANKGFPSPC